MNRQYKTKIEIVSRLAYEDINSFIEKISFEKDIYKNGKTYFLDENRESIIRADSKKKTVELTDRVDEWIFNSINELKRKK
jgi:virulence-associated protein VapD